MVARELRVVVFDGPVPYAGMLDEQHRTRAAVERGEEPDTLFLLEHEPVITSGRNAHSEHILLSPEALAEAQVSLYNSDRGGDVTYHGPGQLVAYPILNLSKHQKSVGWYLRTLERALIGVLADYGLQGEQIEGLTGVWVDGGKVAAIGVGVHQWVTFHGIALNVSPNLGHFGYIVPCGIPDRPVTSLQLLLGSAPAFGEVRDRFEAHFRRAFEIDEATRILTTLKQRG